MKLNAPNCIIATLALILAGWSAWKSSNITVRAEASATPAPATNPSIEKIEQRLCKLESVTPDVGQTMLSIQLHFSKLYFAAEARNWDLARFEREEIIEDLDTVVALKPEDNGVSLAGIIGAFTNSSSGPLASLKDAIDVSDRPLFRKAYQDCIVTCNACHQSTGRPFIVITIPTNPPVFNQRWEPFATTQK